MQVSGQNTAQNQGSNSNRIPSAYATLQHAAIGSVVTHDQEAAGSKKDRQKKNVQKFRQGNEAQEDQAQRERKNEFSHNPTKSTEIDPRQIIKRPQRTIMNADITKL